MSDQTFLADQFLIAMPSMDDPFFARTVIFVCEHNENGAMGMVINRPLTISLSDVLTQMSITNNNPKTSGMPVLYGGPLHQERGFVVHSPTGEWRSTFQVNPDIGVTTSRDILEAIAENKWEGDVLVSLGCAGWQPGKLEEELMSNIWLSVPADKDILFHVPYEKRWESAATSLGIDFHNLSGDSGHA